MTGRPYSTEAPTYLQANSEAAQGSTEAGTDAMTQAQLIRLTIIAALFLATGTAHTETNVLGCFVRTYDKAHLAEHPDQLVTAVKKRRKQDRNGSRWLTSR